MKSKLLSAVGATAFAASLAVTSASAQVAPPPKPKVATAAVNHGNKWKVTAGSILQMQGGSVGCAAPVEIADSIVKANGDDPRELTPVGAVTNGAACGLAPAAIVAVFDWVTGVQDNACSLDVARRALRENNLPQAQQELLWRDGSWERRQAKFLARYAVCYQQR